MEYSSQGFIFAVVLAHMAATLDWSSGGRVEIGLGAGWSPEECEMFEFLSEPSKSV